MVVVKVTFQVPDLGIYYESYGGNDNGGISNKNFDLGDAFKGASTDALTKIGSYLGVGIDVFKGLKENPSKKESSGQPDNKPWLNISSEQWKGALLKKSTIKDLEPFFKISKANREQYERELNGSN